MPMISIPIREGTDRIVRVEYPLDITPAEAAKVAAFIGTLGKPETRSIN